MIRQRHNIQFDPTNSRRRIVTINSLARERSGGSPPSGHFRRDEPGDAPPNKNP